MSQLVELNGKKYAIVKGSVKQGYVPRQSEPIRTTGVQLREHDPATGHFIFTGFPDGLGWDSMDRGTGRGVLGMKDSTCNTIHRPVTMGMLHVAQTHADPAQHPKAYVHFADDLWGLFEEDYDATEITNVVARKFGATTPDWTGGGTVITAAANANGARCFDATVHKGRIIALVTAETNEQIFTIARSTDGITWTLGTSMTGGAELTTTISRRNNFDDDEGKVLSFGNLEFVAYYDSAIDAQIQVYSAVDLETTWVLQGTTKDRHVHALLVWRDPTVTTANAPILVTERNVYKVNTTTNALDPLLPTGVLGGNANDGRGSVVGLDGNLYVPLGSGHILKIELRGDNQLRIVDIGPPGDGLVTTRRGHVNKLIVVPGPWLIAAYGGHVAARNASIFAIDYEPRRDPSTDKEYHAWHSLYYHASDNVDLYLSAYSDEDDDTPRLHFALEHVTDAIMNQIKNPFLNDPSGAATNYQASSFLLIPTDDFGDPQTAGTLFGGKMRLTIPSADESVVLTGGLDGASDTTTALGTFTDAVKSINYGTNGIGVSGSTIARRLAFARGSTTANTPQLYEFEEQQSKRLLGPRWWSFTIDLEESIKVASPTPVATTPQQETVIANLETVAESSTLVTFQVGRMTQTRVRVPNNISPVGDYKIVEGAGLELGYRTGFVTIRVEEVR